MTISPIVTRGARALMLCALTIVFICASATHGEASPARISTGKDLYEACKQLSEFALNPQGPTPRRALYCRQFLSGYFTSLKYMNGNEAANEVQGIPVYAQDCLMLKGPRSYDQLANQVVHHGEWHPELMGKPAMELVELTFGGKPPC
ncbi:MAG: Rap1a/Tai family immunity protein [Parvibaculum sp.]|nr:Rap1a/Tai family immunity protein [Parvibaculum sp.]